MKVLSLSIVCTFALLLSSARASAQEITFSFKGSLSYVSGSPFPDITEGMPFTGTYTFNLSASDTNDWESVGDYFHTSGPYGVVVQIGNRIFRSNPDNVNFLLEVVNNHYSGSDSYGFHSYNNLPVEGANVEFISWFLDDYSQAAVTSTALSPVPPDLNQWRDLGFSITGNHGAFALGGTVTEIQVGTGPMSIPPPTTGIPGPAGPTGPEGPMGPTGAMGPEGPMGPAGPAGENGATGPMGERGPQGPDGPAGPAGPRGPQGPVGATGAQGAQGEGLFSGSMLMLAAGSSAPSGYTLVGTYDLTPSGDSRSRGVALRVDVYRKN